MKINSIVNNFTLKSGYLESDSDSYHGKAMCAGLCGKNEKEYNIAFNGSFPIQNGAAVKGINSIIMEALNKLLDFVHAHNVAGSALMALFLAGVLRPATIMALPGDKDRDDKIYASGHSMASGLIGFCVSTAVTTPWDQALKRVMDYYKNHYDVVIDDIKKKKKEENLKNQVIDDIKKKKEEENLKNQDNEPPKLKYKFKLLEDKYKELVKTYKQEFSPEDLVSRRDCEKYIKTLELEIKNIPDWVIAVPRAMLTIALIPPILKYVFGLEKKKSTPSVHDASITHVQNNIPEQVKSETAAFMFTPKSINSFMSGGQK